MEVASLEYEKKDGSCPRIQDKDRKTQNKQDRKMKQMREKRTLMIEPKTHVFGGKKKNVKTPKSSLTYKSERI